VGAVWAGGGKREKDRPVQSLEPPWGRASRLQRCSGSAATEQDLCKTVKVNWATTLDCAMKPQALDRSHALVGAVWAVAPVDAFSLKPALEQIGKSRRDKPVNK